MDFSGNKYINESKTDTAFREIEAMILSLELLPGQWLSETEMCKRLELGRTPVREALIRLSLAGLVDILPRRGIRVAEVDARHHFELIEVRKTLFDMLVRAAAKRATPAQRIAMQELARHLQALASSESRDDSDNRWLPRLALETWRLIGTAARNPVAGRLMEPLFGLATRMTAIYISSAPVSPESAAGNMPAESLLAQDSLVQAMAQMLEAAAERQVDQAASHYAMLEEAMEQRLQEGVI